MVGMMQKCRWLTNVFRMLIARFILEETGKETLLNVLNINLSSGTKVAHISHGLFLHC